MTLKSRIVLWVSLLFLCSILIIFTVSYLEIDFSIIEADKKISKKIIKNDETTNRKYKKILKY